MSNDDADHGNMDGDQMAGMDHMHPAAGSSASSRPPTMGVHNQMIVGTQTIYLSHLPMFMFDPQNHPHNFQVILEVALSGAGDPQATYAADRANNPQERMYTMSPDPFAMVDLDPQDPRRTALTGTIFRGHLERGGSAIIDRAEARVVNTVYFHAFDPHAQPLTQLEYLLFGSGPELFLAHVITRPPDFDQIVAVTISGPAQSADELRQGIRIIIPGRANTPHARIKAGERVTGQARLVGGPAAPSLELQLVAGTEFYFEEGELAQPMTMRQTPEERAAGF